MRAVALRRLELDRDFPSPKRNLLPHTVDRTYLRGFLPIYDHALDQALRRLRQMLVDLFAEDAELQSSFVAQMVASETVRDRAGKPAVLRRSSNRRASRTSARAWPFWQTNPGQYQRLSDKLYQRHPPESLCSEEKSIERGLHVLNEVVGMVFHGPGD